ncbi:hypothetical protein [Dyadobacter sp. 3J3]|uniref:hypothetical protein n=1 Tax=Dyadobacter sp. 3J3 TaxID=2606600 RepID=UPI001358AB50|nr:hypothetical protein [Dyadobacter sp. 3J3]
MKKIFMILSAFCFVQNAAAQKASDVIENGIPVKSDGKLLFNFEEKQIKYDAAFFLSDTGKRSINFLSLKDSTIFLVRSSGIRVYVRPLNPLNYSYTAENKIIVDPINEAASKALVSIGDVLDKVTAKGTSGAPQTTITNGKKVTVVPECPEIETTKNKLRGVQDLLKTDQKEKINELFGKLKSVSFISFETTTKQLEPIQKGITEIEGHFTSIESELDQAKGLINSYSCPDPSPFVAQYIFNNLLKDLTALKDEQKKRLSNLKNMQSLVIATRDSAKDGTGDGASWVLPIEPTIPADEGKISVYTLKLRQAGYKLDEKREIVSVVPSEFLVKTLRIRAFQRFVPEVSVGMVFTFFKYNTWGTTADSTGQQYVAKPTENTIRNFNITGMVNFNYYIPKSSVHPFYQLGAGINTGIPTILTGFGFRSNINGVRRIAIAGGIAMTWIRTLTELQTGSKISGTDDIEKDLKYEFIWPPKPYVSIQYNF